MNDVIDRITASNPLLGHGPRTRTTGIALDGDRPATASVQKPVRWWNLLIAQDGAPRVHLGPAYR